MVDDNTFKVLPFASSSSIKYIYYRIAIIYIFFFFFFCTIIVAISFTIPLKHEEQIKPRSQLDSSILRIQIAQMFSLSYISSYISNVYPSLPSDYATMYCNLTSYVIVPRVYNCNYTQSHRAVV